MSDYSGSYYSEDSSFKKIAFFPETAFQTGAVYYEVLRVMHEHCLFPWDHLQRLQHSVSLAGYIHTINFQHVTDILRELIRLNELRDGNIRLVLHVKEGGVPVLYAFCIPFSYPSPEMYEVGVPTAVFNTVRRNPNIKQYNHIYQEQVRNFVRTNAIYEALLCDDRDCITEGSRSNVFVISRESVMTAPGNQVLKGITREKIINLCNKLNYNLFECPISIDTLPKLEAVFLTGTSPKILPVNRIGLYTYSTGHPMMRKLMAAYDELIGSRLLGF